MYAKQNLLLARGGNLLVILILALSLAGFQTQTAHATTLCVNPGGTDGCQASIQAAIDAAATGDLINVAAGTYLENVLVNKSVEIAGAGAGSTIVMPAVSNPNACTGSSLCGGNSSNVFLVQANDVKIHDLTADGDNPALTSAIVRDGADLDARNGIIKDTAGTFDNLEVYNTTVQNIYLRGIYSTGGTFNFHENTVQNVQGDYYSIGMFAWYGPGIMANNTVSYANDAISANHSRGIQFLNNTITHSGSGVHTDNAGDGGGTADLIEGNNVSDCMEHGYGIWTFAPHLAPTVNNNTVTNCEIGLSAWGQGAAVTTAFTNNTVNGPSGAAGSVGVYVTTDLISWGYTDVSVNFSGNFISGNETGIYLTADDQSAWNPGPYVPKTITASFSNNKIAGNSFGLGKGTTGTYNATATHNWWGSAMPVWASTIAENVPYDPWYVDEALTILSNVAPATVYVDDDYATTAPSDHFFGYDAFATIQQAVAAVAPGGTVHVAAGTYTETGQIVIGKNLTMVGEDKLTTILKPGQNTGTSGDARTWILVNAGVEFNLRNVTLDGSGKLVETAFLSHGTGVFENNIVKNMYYNKYVGRGVALYGGNMTVRNNSFSNIQRIGMYAALPGTTNAIFDGNIYVGKGPGDWLDYGIEVEAGAHAEVMNNTISDAVGVAASDGSTSAGLYLTTYFASGTSMKAHNNILKNNTAGLEVGYLANDTSTALATHNLFEGNDYGIATTGPAVTADGNWWGSATGPLHTSNPTGTGDAVSGNVSFTPWLCSGTDTSADPGFQPLLDTLCPYQFTGFSQPIDMNVTNSAKAGQTIAVKWRLTDAAGVPVSDPASFVKLYSSAAACETGVPTDAIEEYAPGTSGLQYLGDGYWQFNWKTLKTYKGCRTMYVEFQGGLSSPVVTFQFK